ncbi:MAG: biotin/lipoyl-binding protein [Bradyrhizobium sp.]
MIAFLIIVYVAVVLVLFKVLRIKPTAYLIAAMIVTGVFMIGGVVVVWTQSAPITDKMVTSQYVVQLVPYVKGQVKMIYAQALQPMKKGELLLEIDPAPYEYTVKQVEAQLATSKANVKQAEAALATANSAVPNAQANLDKAKAADELAESFPGAEQPRRRVGQCPARPHCGVSGTWWRVADKGGQQLRDCGDG